MNKQIEKELKILLTEQQYIFLKKQLFPNAIAHVQKNVYFDTINNDLSQKKIALRIRTLGNQKIVTMKYHENNDLIEIEATTNYDDPFLEDQNIIVTLKHHNIDPTSLIAKLTIMTHRTIIDTDVAEIAIDKNIFDDHSIDYELEYEVKKEHDDVTQFQNLLNKLNLTYSQNCDSKLKRALDKGELK